MSTAIDAAHWPYPRWIAHRGAGKLAPENTLAAFRLGAAHGWRMFECDVKLSRDQVPFLLHDSTLERTSDGHGTAGEQDWGALARLDAGAWHSPSFAGEPLATLDDIAHLCLDKDYLLNIEIKPTPGLERQTGEAVARRAAQLWREAPVPPLLTSFAPAALQGALAGAAELPRGLLLDTLWDGWRATATALDCVAVVMKHTLCDAASLAQARAAALRVLCYTVNEEAEVERLLALGVDGLITDRIDAFAQRM